MMFQKTMRKRIVLSAGILLLATPFCHAHGYTLTDANNIILILALMVVILIVMGCFSLYYTRIISQRNEQLRRILTALDDYRAIVGDKVTSLDEQEEILKDKLLKKKEALGMLKDKEQSFFVKMDARMNKERPFTNPDFDHDALVKFMGVDNDTFCKLVPRYTDPARTLDYINSLRAEYAAKILMERTDESTDNIVRKCGFKNAAAYNNAFKFSFGITPTEFLNGMNQMFKKKK